MFRYAGALLLLLLIVPRSCNGPGQDVQLKYTAAGKSPEVLAVYEAWFGFPKHISVGYSSHDTAVLDNQIEKAKRMGISGFVIDWYGDREPFIDRSYALMQQAAAKHNFRVAMMYDESNHEDGATDEAIADFNMFYKTYLAPNAPGREAYLTYQGHPVIFIFPKGNHTHWDKVRAAVNKWPVPPLLIYENLPGQYPNVFDGYYAWINPGSKGWQPDGSDWGKEYLDNFYDTMVSKYPDKIIVGGAWASFDDRKASWSLNRHMSARCGDTYKDTFNFWRKYVPANQPIPFVLVETWNDYEEGSAVEPGLPACGNNPQQLTSKNQSSAQSARSN
jgi:hypothetical protein